MTPEEFEAAQKRLRDEIDADRRAQARKDWERRDAEYRRLMEEKRHGPEGPIHRKGYGKMIEGDAS